MTNQDINESFENELIKQGISYTTAGIKELLSKFWKNHVVKGDIEAEIDNLLSGQVETAKKLTFVKTIALGNQIVLLNSIYEPLEINRTEFNRELDTKKSVKYTLEGGSSQLLADNQRVLIIDGAGMGKSTVLKNLFINDVKRATELVFFSELRNMLSFDVVEELTLNVEKYTGGKQIDYKNLSWILKEFGGICYFDGFDEVPTTKKGLVLEALQYFADNFPRVKIVFSSRDDEILRGIKSFTEFNIVPLTKEKAYSLIRRYDAASEISDFLIKEIEKDHNHQVHEFLKSPLLVTLLFKAFTYKNKIPLKKSLFYRQVFDALYESHDLSKGGAYVHEKTSGLDSDDFHRVVRHIGALTIKDGIKDYSKDELQGLLQKISGEELGFSFKASNMLNDLVNIVPLFLKDGLSYKWSHKSLQDYFAASYFEREVNETRKIEILNHCIQEETIETNTNLLDLWWDLNEELLAVHLLKPALQRYLREYDKLPSSLSHAHKDFLTANHSIIAILKKDAEEVQNDAKAPRHDWVRKFTNLRGRETIDMERGLMCRHLQDVDVVIEEGHDRVFKVLKNLTSHRYLRLVENVSRSRRTQDLAYLEDVLIDLSKSDFNSRVFNDKMLDVLPYAFSGYMFSSREEVVKEIKTIGKIEERRNQDTILEDLFG